MEARKSASQRRTERKNRLPTWRAAFNRAALAAAVFFALLVLVMDQSLGASLAFALFVLVLYAPLFYFTDSFIYRLRQRRKERQTGD
jgi:Flp pilus assembly protein TadB